MRSPMNMHDTRTQCRCSDRAILMDETAIGMGVNCLKCGLSAEHLLPPEERRRIREVQRQKRRAPDYETEAIAA